MCTSKRARRARATFGPAADRGGRPCRRWSTTTTRKQSMTTIDSDSHASVPTRMGFFTDTSVCIGCKACEVACKEWNGVPDDGLNFLGQSYDNTGQLGANTWRHVAFIEQTKPVEVEENALGGDVRWLMSSDVCKHCTHAACLDVCPTGSLFRTEF